MEEELRRPRNVRDLTTLRECKQEVHLNIPPLSTCKISHTHDQPIQISRLLLLASETSDHSIPFETFTVQQMRRLEEKLRNPKGYITLTERIKKELMYRQRTKAKPEQPGPELNEDEFATPPSSPKEKKRKAKKKKSPPKKKVKKKSPPKKIVPKKKKVPKKTPSPPPREEVREDLLNITSEEWPFQSEAEIQESIESRLRELQLREKEIDNRIERKREELERLEASREAEETRSSNIRERLRARGRRMREKKRVVATGTEPEKPDAYDLVDQLDTKQIDKSVAGTSVCHSQTHTHTSSLEHQPLRYENTSRYVRHVSSGEITS